jgi:hypothetical protein
MVGEGHVRVPIQFQNRAGAVCIGDLINNAEPNQARYSPEPEKNIAQYLLEKINMVKGYITEYSMFIPLVKLYYLSIVGCVTNEKCKFVLTRFEEPLFTFLTNYDIVPFVLKIAGIVKEFKTTFITEIVDNFEEKQREKFIRDFEKQQKVAEKEMTVEKANGLLEQVMKEEKEVEQIEKGMKLNEKQLKNVEDQLKNLTQEQLQKVKDLLLNINQTPKNDSVTIEDAKEE